MLVYNPHGVENSRRKKPLTREQVEKRQAKAVKFAADVLEDDDLADELEALSPQEYAERKSLLMTNPTKKRREPTSMRRDEMKDLVKEALSEAIKQTRRANPATAVPAVVATVTPETQAKSDKKKILDRVDDAAAALADGDEDEALDILNGVLNDYDDEEAN